MPSENGGRRARERARSEASRGDRQRKKPDKGGGGGRDWRRLPDALAKRQIDGQGERRERERERERN